MAIIQISRIQQRTGNLSDVPQLSAGELGWADDARRLFIGNEVTRTGDPSPNNTEILTQYSNISFNQVASVVNPQNWDVVQYDAANAQWVNRHIYLTDEPVTQATTIHGNLTITGNLNPISNTAVKITGGTSGQVLATDGAGNLSWVVQSGGGGGGTGSTFVITNVKIGNGNITAGNLTVVTATSITVANADQVLITGITGTGNVANLNGNIFYVGNVDVANGNVSLYTNSTLTTAVNTAGGTYTGNGNMTLRNGAEGIAGAVQLSDGSGHFTTATGLQYSSGLQTLSSPILSATNATDNALVSGGGANITSNLFVGLNANIGSGNLRVGGIANVVGNLNVTGNAVVTGNATVSNNATVTANITIGGTATIAGNTAISGANVSLGNVGNIHIQGGNSQIALAGTVTIVGGVITAIAVSDGGAGYLSAPTVTITGANTTPATATATIVGGVVQSPLTITGGGTGYSAGTTAVTFSLPEAEYLTTDGRGNLAWAAAGGSGAAPVGSITMWPTSTAPLGYLLCNGSNVSRTTFNSLFAIIGTSFGAGDGSTTFTLPDYRDRFAMGAGGTIVTAAAQVGGSANAVVVAHTHTAASNSVFSGNALSVHNHTATSVFTGNAASTAHTHTITDPTHGHAFTAGPVVGYPSPTAGNFLGAVATALAAGTRYGQVGSSVLSNAATGITINSATAGTPTGTVTTTVADSSGGIPSGTVTTTTTVNSVGVSGVNQNLPPFLGIFFIIKT